MFGVFTLAIKLIVYFWAFFKVLLICDFKLAPPEDMLQKML